MIPITVAISLLMSMMVEVAWPISWISMALLYRTSLSNRVSSAALRWASMVCVSIIAPKPLGLNRAQADQDDQQQVKTAQESKGRQPKDAAASPCLR